MPDKIFVFPNYSITDQGRLANCLESGWCRKVAFCLVPLLFLFQTAAMASYPQVSFSADSIEHQNFRMHQVRARLDEAGGFWFDAGRVAVEGREFNDLSVRGEIEEALFEAGKAFVRSTVRSGRFEAGLEFERHNGETSASLEFERQQLETFKGLDGLPPGLMSLSRGHVDAVLKLRQTPGSPPDIAMELAIGDLGFDSPDGRFAAEALYVDVQASVSGNEWSAPKINGFIRSGELLIDDFYRDFSDGEMEFAFRPEWRNGEVDIRSIKLSDNHSLAAEGRVVLDSQHGPDSWRVEISRLDLEFPGAYERYMESIAAVWTLNGLAVTGDVSWSGEWSGGEFRSGDLGITGLSIVDTQRRRFAMTGLDAKLRPGDHAFDSHLTWQGLLLGRVNLGRGEVELDSEVGKFAIVQPLALEVLGGRLNLYELQVLLPGASGDGSAEPDIRLRADLVELDMEQLTAAFGWPPFSGKISGQIPGVSLEDGVLDLEGEILVSVFDGLLTVDDLRIERPFGVLPSLAANVEAENLDLELLTSTFSFGQISGRIEGYVRDLRMLDWKPVAFDAWLGTPRGQQGSEGISRQAVNHLTTVGGGRATTALTSPVMRLFNNFSYKRLGLGCRMQNNVCEVRGVSEDDVSVLIMEGAGVPKITIRAFNRRVDWPQLLAHLVSASEGDSVRVGD
jgi:hypothetical protein